MKVAGALIFAIVLGLVLLGTTNAREGTTQAIPSGASQRPSTLTTRTATPTATRTRTPTGSTTKSTTRTRTATPTTTPTATRTSTLSVSPTSTPTASLTPFPLGLRLDASTTVSFWNQYARSADGAHTYRVNVDYVIAAVAGRKSLTYSQLGYTASTISAAQPNHIPLIDFNREGTNDCTVLLSDEANAYATAVPTGEQMIFTPSGNMLVTCFNQSPAQAASIVTNADSINYQTEALQESDPTYAADVHATILALKALKPMVVWAQVSVNPRANRNLTAAQVIADVDALEDGSPGAPDGINVYFDSTCDRINVMEQVIQHYRSPNASAPTATPQICPTQTPTGTPTPRPTSTPTGVPTATPTTFP